MNKKNHKNILMDCVRISSHRNKTLFGRCICAYAYMRPIPTKIQWKRNTTNLYEKDVKMKKKRKNGIYNTPDK